MVAKHVSQIGEPVIRAKAKAAAMPPSPQTRKIVRDLIDSMRHYGLIGMAAPQIGIGLRIFVTELRETKVRGGEGKDVVRVFINPRILRRAKEVRLGGEGCGSVAHSGLFATVPRARSVSVTACNEKGKRFVLQATGILSAVIQHETDHLDGMVFLDRLPDMKGIMDREAYIEKLSKKAKR